MFKLKSRLEATLLTAFVAAASLGSVGCKTPEVCKELGTCGGALIEDGQTSKTWDIGGACLNQVSGAPTIPSLIHQAPTLGGEAPPRRTQANFCSEMILQTKQGVTSIANIQLWYPSLPLQAGVITYKNTGDYLGSITYFENNLEMDFAADCFLTQGFKIVPTGTAPTPDQFSCQDFAPILAQGLATQPNLTNVKCQDDSLGGGCACTFDLLLVTAIAGKYATVGNVVTHYDTTAHSPASSADYCVNGNTLELSGYKRTFLFNQPALRSLVLTAE